MSADWYRMERVTLYMSCVVFQALSGFLMMMTQNGKLLYISDNAAEYLGHSMVSISYMCGVCVYVIYDELPPADHQAAWRGIIPVPVTLV